MSDCCLTLLCKPMEEELLLDLLLMSAGRLPLGTVERLRASQSRADRRDS